MKRVEMVRAGTEKLEAAEQALGAALVEVAGLACSLERMRMDANMSMTVGQNAIGGIARAFTMLTDARGVLVEVHAHLNDVKAQLGCRTVAAGNLDKPEEPPVNPTGFYVVGDQEAA